MITAGLSDYHVHYYADPCSHPEMTLANIDAEAVRLGLSEICVLKHYSAALPNGQDSWVHWKRIVPEQFARFLQDIHSYRSATGIRMLAGVETELVDDAGTINIPRQDAEKLDAVILSVHWLPRMATAAPAPALVPGALDQGPPDLVAAWHAQLRACGTEAILANFIAAYVRAIERNPKVLVLGHMFDGLLPLRNFAVPVDDLSDACVLALMEPLLRCCAQQQVLWELTPEPAKRPAILKRANALGVRFCATADAHFLQTPGWANLRDHARAESYLNSLGLRRGVLKREPLQDSC